MEGLHSVYARATWPIAGIVYLVYSALCITITGAIVAGIRGKFAGMAIGAPRVLICFHDIELRADLFSILTATVVVSVSGVWSSINIQGRHPYKIKCCITAAMSHRKVFVILKGCSEQIRFEIHFRIHCYL